METGEATEDTYKEKEYGVSLNELPNMMEIPFYKTGVAFERYETGVFFTEMMKRFSQQKYNESQENENLDKKQKKEEDTSRVHTDKMKLYRKQEY